MTTPENIAPVQSAVANMLSAGRVAGLDEKDDVGKMLIAFGEAIAAVEKIVSDLGAQMKSMEARPVADIERAVRQSLAGLRPHFEKRWRWQRWSAAIMAGAVAAAAIGAVMYHVGRDVGGTDSARWTEWCAVPEHVSRLPVGTYCLVPVPGARS